MGTAATTGEAGPQGTAPGLSNGTVQPVTHVYENLDNGVTYSDQYWKDRTDPTNVAGSALRDASFDAKTTADSLKGDAMGTGPRVAPQAAAPPSVISDVSTVEKPTATMAAAAAPVVAPTVAPIERIKAATVGQGPQAGAGYVAPTNVNEDAQRQFRTRQENLTNALEAATAGKEVTSGELAARQLATDAANEQRSLAAGVHGYGGLAAQRAAGRNIAGIESKSAANQTLLRQKGVEDARQQLAGVLGQAREQDIGLATKQAELTQGAGTTNANLTTQVSISNADREAARLKTNAELQQAAAVGDAAAQNELAQRDAAMKLAAAQGNQTSENQINLANAAAATNTSIVGATESNKVGLANAEQDLRAQLANADNSTKVALANAGFTLEGRQIDDQKNIAAVLAMLEAKKQAFTSADDVMKTQIAIDQMNEAIRAGNRDATLGLVTSIIGTVGAVGATAAKSDRRAKTDIKKASGADLDDFLGALEAWTYKYKKPADGEGKRMGPMAQELERSMLGKGMVRKGPDGDKVVDTNALTMALAGAVARLAKQQRRAGRAA